MTRKYKSAVRITSFWLGAAILFTGETDAGQFKRMTGSSTLAVNGNLAAHASPRNQGAAMEMDTLSGNRRLPAQLHTDAVSPRTQPDERST